jgi:hypothetical protein
LHKKQKFSPEKNVATRKDVESYSQMPGKHILTIEFSSFSSSELRAFGAPYRGLCPRCVCPFSEVAPTVPEIMDPPLVGL